MQTDIQCRGTLMLGTACQRCNKCRKEREHLSKVLSAAQFAVAAWRDGGPAEIAAAVSDLERKLDWND